MPWIHSINLTPDGTVLAAVPSLREFHTPTGGLSSSFWPVQATEGITVFLRFVIRFFHHAINVLDYLANHWDEYSDDDGLGEVIGTAMHQYSLVQVLLLYAVKDTLCDLLQLHAKWGRYVRGESGTINERTQKPYRAWLRQPMGGTLTIPLREGTLPRLAIADKCPEVLIEGNVGTLFRHRATIWIFLFVFIAVGLSLKKGNIKFSRAS